MCNENLRSNEYLEKKAQDTCAENDFIEAREAFMAYEEEQMKEVRAAFEAYEEEQIKEAHEAFDTYITEQTKEAYNAYIEDQIAETLKAFDAYDEDVDESDDNEYANEECVYWCGNPDYPRCKQYCSIYGD